MPRPSEAETESEAIYPALQRLGWSYLLQPAVDRRRRDVDATAAALAPRDLVLRMMAALEAGRPDARVEG